MTVKLYCNEMLDFFVGCCWAETSQQVCTPGINCIVTALLLL